MKKVKKDFPKRKALHTALRRVMPRLRSGRSDDELDELVDLLWQALTDWRPFHWYELPDDLVLAAAQSVNLGSKGADMFAADSALHGYGNENADDVEERVVLAVDKLRLASRERRELPLIDDSRGIDAVQFLRSRDLYSRSDAYSWTLCVALYDAWLKRGERAWQIYTFRYALIKKFPQISHMAGMVLRMDDEELAKMVRLWASRPEGRPRRGASVAATKWERISAFAKQLGIPSTPGALSRANTRLGQLVKELPPVPTAAFLPESWGGKP